MDEEEFEEKCGNLKKLENDSDNESSEYDRESLIKQVKSVDIQRDGANKEMTLKDVVTKRLISEGEKFNSFPEDIREEYNKLDKKIFSNYERREEKKKDELKTDTAEKQGIEQRLEDSDKALSELIQLGTELVTNVKVANEKREVARRNYEAIKREGDIELLQDLKDESIEAMKKFEVISKKWSELQEIKEPMGLYEQLQIQKERINDLMKQKDNIIKECQDEIRRTDKTYYDDLQRQNADIYSLVERIDNQIELVKDAYNEHIELLQKTIEIERKNISENASKNWEELYNKWLNNEQIKMDNEKSKEESFIKELELITLEYEELMRSTRIRLEKDAEALQLELRVTKSNVFLNSEKLNYNFQVLKKRNDENIIIRNQQKKRLNKLNETAFTLNQKIQDIKMQTNNNIERFKNEILQLNKNINDLQMKTDNFTVIDEKKYESVWKMHDDEAKNLISKILNIDRILYEEQLGLDWIPPLENSYPNLSIRPLSRKQKKQSKSTSKNVPQQCKTDEQKLEDTKLLRKILCKVADRAGFLVEDKIHEILKPYTEKEKTLIKIDCIFRALDITKLEDIESITEYFLPHSWCLNCTSSKIIEDKIEDEMQLKFHKQISCEFENESTSSGESNKQDDQKSTCPNHNLVIESALVIPALRNFIENKSKSENLFEQQQLHAMRNKSGQLVNILKQLNKNEIHDYWAKYKTIFPEHKRKLWKFLEHGLNHYLNVLKEREELNSECEILKRQNIEFQHLLKKYTPTTESEQQRQSFSA